MFSMQKFLFLLLSMVLLGPLGIDLYLPAIPAIALGLNSSEGVIQSSISLFILVMGLGQLVAGPLVDKFGRRPIAILGVVVYLAGAIIAATYVAAWMFLLACVVQGLAVGCTSVVICSGVRGRMSGNDAARAYGFLNGTLNIIPALAPLIGGLIAQYYGWRAPFWALFGYTIAVLILILFKLPETRPADTQSGGAMPFKQYARILLNKRFITFAAVNAGAMGMALTYVSLAPTVLMSQAGLTPFEFSLVFGANGFWIMAVSFIANRIIQKVGRPRCLATGGVLMFTGCAGLVAGLTLVAPEAQHATWLYMMPVACACAGLAFLIGPATSYALEPFSNEAGVASALVGSVQMTGGALFGFIAMALPLQPKVSLSLVMLAGGCLALLARRASKKSAGGLTRIG